jgi:uncharacterized membrane protein YvbJ
MFCQHCGKEISEVSAFCMSCGKPIASVEKKSVPWVPIIGAIVGAIAAAALIAVFLARKNGARKNGTEQHSPAPAADGA